MGTEGKKAIVTVNQVDLPFGSSLKRQKRLRTGDLFIQEVVPLPRTMGGPEGVTPFSERAIIFSTIESIDEKGRIRKRIGVDEVLPGDQSVTSFGHTIQVHKEE